MLTSIANAVMAVAKVKVAVSPAKKKPTSVRPKPLGVVVVRNLLVTNGNPVDAEYVTPFNVPKIVPFASPSKF